LEILLISDIHANFPALEAVINHFNDRSFEAVLNCGDSVVYAPFPNETLHWLADNNVISILGNTDRKLIKLLKGRSFKKPRKKEKRIMYTWTSTELDARSKKYILSLKKSRQLSLDGHSIGLFHGSPADPDEFLFPDTSPARFAQLAATSPAEIIITGHSHTPYHIKRDGCHFINPGSIGRMFDSNPAASCAVLTLNGSIIHTAFFRIPWEIQRTTEALRNNNMPQIYQLMYQMGKKLN